MAKNSFNNSPVFSALHGESGPTGSPVFALAFEDAKGHAPVGYATNPGEAYRLITDNLCDHHGAQVTGVRSIVNTRGKTAYFPIIDKTINETTDALDGVPLHGLHQSLTASGFAPVDIGLGPDIHVYQGTRDDDDGDAQPLTSGSLGAGRQNYPQPISRGEHGPDNTAEDIALRYRAFQHEIDKIGWALEHARRDVRQAWSQEGLDAARRKQAAASATAEAVLDRYGTEAKEYPAY